MFLQYYQMKQMNSRNPQAAAANPQMQTMQKFFPIIFGVIYLRVPAGATIYMVVSSAMRIGTQEVMFRTGMVTPVVHEREIGSAKRTKRPSRRTNRRRSRPRRRRPPRTAPRRPRRRCRPARAVRVPTVAPPPTGRSRPRERRTARRTARRRATTRQRRRRRRPTRGRARSGPERLDERVEWVEVAGKTIEEATAQALDQLGVAVGDAEVIVMSEPKTGLFGRMRVEARVKARVRPVGARPRRERPRRGKSSGQGGRQGGHGGRSAGAARGRRDRGRVQRIERRGDRSGHGSGDGDEPLGPPPAQPQQVDDGERGVA